MSDTEEVVLKYQIRPDAAGLVEAAQYTDIELDGYVTVSQDVFFEASNHIGRCVWDGDNLTVLSDTLPEAPARYSKRALFDAMTDEEYEVFQSVERQQAPREARVFREAQELSSADPAFATVDALMRQAYGDERAEAIFAAAKY